jgi:hypothetical protein
MSAPRPVAATVPQLLNQALAAKLDDASLRRLGSGAELALRIFDGCYMSDEPLATHHVRVASIGLAERWPLHVVLACLLHATHSLHTMHTRRRRPRPAHRAFLRREIGREAEELVWRFLGFSYQPDDVQRYIRDAKTSQGTDRELLQIRVANELAHYTDRAIRYGRPERRPEENAKLSIELARALGLSTVAHDLEWWASQCADSPLPEALAPGGVERELPGRHWWESSPAERGITWVVRRARRWLGGVGGNAGRERRRNG